MRRAAANVVLTVDPFGRRAVEPLKLCVPLNVAAVRVPKVVSVGCSAESDCDTVIALGDLSFQQPIALPLVADEPVQLADWNTVPVSALSSQSLRLVELMMVSGYGVTDVAVDAAPVPNTFVAVTLTEYVTPVVMPVMEQVVPAVEQVTVE